jgi:hypothetical protein
MSPIRVEKRGSFAFVVGVGEDRRIRLEGKNQVGIVCSGEVYIQGNDATGKDVSGSAGSVSPDDDINPLFPEELKNEDGDFDGNFRVGQIVIVAGVKFTGI